MTQQVSLSSPIATSVPVSATVLTKRGRALEDGKLLVKSWGAVRGTFEHHARRDGDIYLVETVRNGAVIKTQSATSLIGALDLMHMIAPAYGWKIVDNEKAAMTAEAIITA